MLALPAWGAPAASEVNGWPRWQAATGPLRFTQGAALADEAEGQSLEWLRAQTEAHPDSRALWLALYQRLQTETSEDEAFGCLLRALELPDRERWLAAAAGHLERGQTGQAVAALRRAGQGWVKPLEQVQSLARLLERGWKPGPALELQRNGQRLTLRRGTPVGRQLWLGSHQAWRDDRAITVEGELALEPVSTQPALLDQLEAELSSDGSVTEVVGFSVQGRPIRAVRLGRGSETVLLFGAFHGDEPAGPFLLQQLQSLLKTQPKELAGKTVVLVSTLNPDGLNAGTRANARGVDLNRNYPAKNWTSEGKGTRYWGGPRASSEPETRVVLELLERYQPRRILSIHQPLHNVNYDGPAAKLAAKLAQANGYPVEPDIGYPTPGSFGTYAGRERSIPTITLELPEGKPAQLWQANREALLRFIKG